MIHLSKMESQVKTDSTTHSEAPFLSLGNTGMYTVSLTLEQLKQFTADRPSKYDAYLPYEGSEDEEEKKEFA